MKRLVLFLMCNFLGISAANALDLSILPAEFTEIHVKHVYVPPSCQELNESYYKIFHADFKMAESYHPFPCPSPLGNLVQAMHALYTLRFNPGPGPKPIDYYDYVTSRITKMILQDGDESDPVGGEAQKNGEITLHTVMLNKPRSLPALLVHEARHLMPNDPAHVTCNHGNYGDKEGNCDETFLNLDWKYGSGYNAEYAFMSWVLMRAPQAEFDRVHLRWYILYLMENNFNQVDSKFVDFWTGFNPN